MNCHSESAKALLCSMNYIHITFTWVQSIPVSGGTPNSGWNERPRQQSRFAWTSGRMHEYKSYWWNWLLRGHSNWPNLSIQAKINVYFIPNTIPIQQWLLNGHSSSLIRTNVKPFFSCLGWWGERERTNCCKVRRRSKHSLFLWAHVVLHFFKDLRSATGANSTGVDYFNC